MSKNSRSRAVPAFARRASSRLNRSSPPSRRADIGIALAGGGPFGVSYEIGALNALAESLAGIDFTRLGTYVGVSAGSAVAAGLANGFTPRDICALFVEGESPADNLKPFDPSWLLRPAWNEYADRLAMMPRAVLRAMRQASTRPVDGRLAATLSELGRLLPAGLLDNRPIDRYLRSLFVRPGRTNDFRALECALRIVATDLQTGTAVELGSSGHDSVPISSAVQASAALPLVFPPVTIGSRRYVDGALTKTLHASAAYRAGARLVFGINPLVPYDAAGAGQSHAATYARALPTLLSQTFRSLMHSRMHQSVAHYDSDFPGLDLMLFEPRRSDETLFLTNIFSYASRRRVCEHAYQHTRADLLARRSVIEPRLAAYGISLRSDILEDESRTLVRPLVHAQSIPAVVRELEYLLNALTTWMQCPFPRVLRPRA